MIVRPRMPEDEGRAPAMLRASDVGRYTYCARAWWLERVAGLTPTNREALAQGRQRHRGHGHLVGAAGRQIRLARVLLWVLAGLALALAASLLWP
jgi:hypothetical protein